MKKILFVANTDKHILLCHIPYLKYFKDNGYIVHVATNTNNNIPFCDKKINLGIRRNPFHLKNILAIFKIRRLYEYEKYDVVSCHTPMGGFLGRVMVIGKRKPRVFYTAHGLHFYKGSSLVSWIMFYPIEKYLSKYTTALFTMNNEDYSFSKNKFKCDVYKINGIGYCADRLNCYDKNFKKKIGMDGYYVILCVAEISKRKQQVELLRCLKKIDLVKEKIKVIFLGDSLIKSFSKKVDKYQNVYYYGFNNNVGDYINMCNLFISSSKQEGLPLSIMEAMHFNKPIVATNCRGNRDLIKNNVNGFLVDNVNLLVDKILDVKKHGYKKICNKMEQYEINQVIKDVTEIYNKYLESDRYEE